MLPTRIVQTKGGFAALDLALTQVEANEPVEITVPDDVRTAKDAVRIDKLAEGVWWLGGGTHHSVAIEQARQMVVVELPLHEGRARAVLAAANRLVAGKKVQAVINTHHHFDQAGGLRTAVAEGITVYTSALAKPYLENALARPVLHADPASASAGAQAKLVGVQDIATLGDPVRAIEIHELQGSLHARGLLVVWLSREQLLIQADAFTPSAPGAPQPAVPNANHVNLVHNLDRLKLAPRRIVPLQGRVVPALDLYIQVGRKAPP
jgi:glyoxylase-like metal-dependent hydrolase (beta-lactamase superfamily II)